ncbi:hypothetical protein ACFX2I_005656 [Malus domestica]
MGRAKGLLWRPNPRISTLVTLGASTLALVHKESPQNCPAFPSEPSRSLAVEIGDGGWVIFDYEDERAGTQSAGVPYASLSHVK